jgi:hypothetical protein
MAHAGRRALTTFKIEFMFGFAIGSGARYNSRTMQFGIGNSKMEIYNQSFMKLGVFLLKQTVLLIFWVINDH